MKETERSLADALQYVKQRRSCINPNDGFRNQLLVYEGILLAKSVRPIRLPLSFAPLSIFSQKFRNIRFAGNVYCDPTSDSKYLL